MSSDERECRALDGRLKSPSSSLLPKTPSNACQSRIRRTITPHTRRVAHPYSTAFRTFAVAKNAIVDTLERCQWYSFDNGGRNDRQ